MRDTELKPIRRVTCYEVCCLPEDHRLAASFTVTVQRRRGDKWVIKNCGRYLDPWTYPHEWHSRLARPSVTHSFSDDLEALRLAGVVAQQVRVAGFTAAQVLARDASPPGCVNAAPSADEVEPR